MLFSDLWSKLKKDLTQFFYYFRPRTRPLFPVNLRNLTSVWFGVRLQGRMATLDPSELNSAKIFLLLPWASELELWCTHQEFKPFKYMRFLKSYLFVCSYPLVQFGIIEFGYSEKATKFEKIFHLKGLSSKPSGNLLLCQIFVFWVTDFKLWLLAYFFFYFL